MLYGYLRKLSVVFIGMVLGYNFANAAVEATKFPAIWNVGNPNEFFVGRNNYLAQLNKSLSENKSKMLTIVGGAGIGKTQIAKKYAEIYCHNYDIVWWFDSEKDMDEQVVKLVTEWNKIDKQKMSQINLDLSSVEIIKQLKNHLRTKNYNWLLIFDNIADKPQITNYLPQKHGDGSYGHILVTSKNPLVWKDKMALDKFTRNESIELLIKITEDNNKAAADKLAEMLRDFPLAVVQAGTYIKVHPSVNMEQYRELFFTQREELWKVENKSKKVHSAFDNYEFTVFTTISLILKDIEKSSPESINLVGFCAFLNNKNIPEIFLTEYLSNHTRLSNLEQNEAIAILAQYSLITHQKINLDYHDNNLSDKVISGLKSTFTMHEITQLAVQDYFSKKEKKSILQKGLKVVASCLPDKVDIVIPLLEYDSSLLSHMQTIAANAVKQGLYNKYLVTIYVRELEYYFLGQRDANKGSQSIEKIEKVLKMVPKDNVNLCRYHLMKALYLSSYKLDYNESIKEAKEALRLLDKTKGSYDEEYLRCYNGLTQYYNNLGDNEGAIKYAKLGREIVSNATGFLSSKNFLFHGLAKIHRDNEEFDKAIFYASKAAELASKRGNGTVIGDFPLYFLESEILIKAKEFKVARTKINKLFKMVKEKIQNIDHPSVASVRIVYGYSSFFTKDQDEGNYDAEKDMILSGQNMFRRLLGEKYNKSRIIAFSHKFMGEIYEKEGDMNKAQAEYTIAEDIYMNIYDMKIARTGDISDVYTRLAIINAKLKEPVSAQRYLDLHRKYFGYEHPRTIEITNYFIDHGLQVGF